MIVPYVTFMKHAQKVTKSVYETRTILKGVYHAPDGSLYVTDSRRLYLAKGAHSNAEASIVDPKTGHTISGSYPDCSRLIPNRLSAKLTARLDVKEALDAFTALLKVNQVDGKGYESIDAEPVDGIAKIAFIAENPVMAARYEVPIQGGKMDELTFNATFIVDALKLFKDVDVTDAELRFYGDLRPFTITAGKDDELLALIMPIRRA